MKEEAKQVFDVHIRSYRGNEPCWVGNETVGPGDKIVVERDGELECGVVMSGPNSSASQPANTDMLQMVRIADESDIKKLEQNQALEKKAYITAREKIRERELPMKLAKVECNLDRKKIRFFFTAENRIDFRELVKDLAYVFKTRIEMRQIGVRDEARMMGGYSHCGRAFCCATYLRKFDPVTIRMAKDQCLALNPTKISGACGRLMCCLDYEHRFYRDCRKRFPKVGTKIKIREQEGVVTGFDVLKETVALETEENDFEVSLSEFEELRTGSSSKTNKQSSPQDTR